MKSYSSTIHIRMLTGKFYCHNCGYQLSRTSRTRTVKRGDPDYGKHSRMGRTHLIGDIELTEYDFHCPSCGNTIPFDEQCVMERIQKSVGKPILTQQEIEINSEKIRSALEWEKKSRKIILQAIGIAAFVLILWLQWKA